MRGCYRNLGFALGTLLICAFPSWSQSHAEFIQGKEAAAREILVKFKAANFSIQSFNQMVTALDIEASELIGSAGTVWIRSRSKTAASLLRDLHGLPEIEYVEPNYIVTAVDIPSDPRFGELWGLENTGQLILGTRGLAGADISAVPAWEITHGSPANVAVVVDTGIDYTHADLADNVWSAPAEFTVDVGSGPILCDAGTHGYNAITNTCDPRDDNNHGTHVSGTIGAVGNNNLGVVGVNWVASIMGSKFLNAGGSGTTANAIKAIEFAIQVKNTFGADANVRLLSNSWGGGGFSQALLDEIGAASDNDMLFVAAAGNNNGNNDAAPFYPASYDSPNVISVAATTNVDTKSGFSNFGANTVHLGAPGSSVLSTIRNQGYAYFSGTSMATPHVSGAALLVISVCPLKTAELKSTILANVDPIDALSGITITGGRLNVANAITACLAARPE